VCSPVSPEICGDGFDNDIDGFTDEGCIGDRAWHDLNENGIQDPGELGLVGATFILRTSSGAVVQVAVSDLNGIYHFSNVPPGTYFIEVIPPAGFTLTAADAADDTRDSDFDEVQSSTAIFAFPANGSIDHLDAGFH
jgi:hypothetical protein